MLPAVFQVVLFGAFLGAYLGITWWDARAATRGRGAGAGVLLLVALLTLPTGLASVAQITPPSTDTASVATTPLPMAAGTMASASISSDLNGATVTAAAPSVWGEVPMWGCDPAATCTFAAPALVYATQAGSITDVNAADYAPAPTFYLEAVMTAPAGQRIYAILLDKAAGTTIAASEVSTNLNNPTRVRSLSFTLSGDKEYQFQTKNDGVSAGGTVYNVKLVVQQQFPTKAATQVRLSGADTRTTNTFATTTRAALWRDDHDQMDGVTAASFEAVAQMSAGTGAVRLMDRTTGSQVVSLTISALTATRSRSADILGSLTAGHEYEVEIKGGGGAIKVSLHLARVVFTQSSASVLTKVVRYVDLGWQNTTSSTTYVREGYDSRYHMGSEYGPVSGYFEATLSNGNNAQTTFARLVDRLSGSAIASSDVQVTGNTRARARSGLLTLDTADADYGAEFRASGNTANARNAWLIVLQDGGKMYDYALRTRNDVAGSCTWAFTLQHTSSSGLARMRGATLALRGNGAVQDQVKVVNGVVTQATGSAVNVPFNTSAQHLVTTDPTSAGSSTLNADLVGACAGVHTLQHVTYTLT
jgi:hypothetical protein